MDAEPDVPGRVTGRLKARLLLAGRTALLAVAAAATVAATDPETAAVQQVVHAVIFYSPTCPHCHKVIAEDLPPLQARYGARLVIAGVDVTTPRGQRLYRATVAHFGIGPDRQGVPTLVIGSEVLVGDTEIPSRLPGLVEKGIAAGGTPWPPVPELLQALAEHGGDQAAADTEAGSAVAPPTSPAQPLDPATLTPDVTRSGPWARFQLDPVGNSLSVLVLLGMVVALLASLRSVVRGSPSVLPLPGWTLPFLAAAGMAVASYMALVEITGSQAVCGPVGDCNTVQQSAYATLFGVPVGVLGQAGYLAMFGAWVLGVVGPRRWAGAAWLALWVMTTVGVAFSAYLTFLEPFVIGATCVWCLTSAVVMTLMLLGATPRVAVQRT